MKNAVQFLRQLCLATISQQYLHRTNEYKNFIKGIITGDEIWFCEYYYRTENVVVKMGHVGGLFFLVEGIINCT